jgi:hypothetical protein
VYPNDKHNNKPTTYTYDNITHMFLSDMLDRFGLYYVKHDQRFKRNPTAMARGIPVVFVVVGCVVVLLLCLSLGYARCSFYPCCPAFPTRPVHPLALLPCPFILILLIGALIPPTPAVPPLARPLLLAPSPFPSSSISPLPSEPCLGTVIFIARFVVSFVVPKSSSYRLGPPSYRLGPPLVPLGPPFVPLGPPPRT